MVTYVTRLILAAISWIIQCLLFLSLMVRFRAAKTDVTAAFKYTICYYVIAIVVQSLEIASHSLRLHLREIISPLIWMTVLESLLYILCFWSTYLLLFRRLRETFEETVYEPKRYQLVLHYLNLAVLFMIVPTAVLLGSGLLLYDERIFVYFMVAVICGFFFFLSAGYAHLLYAFNHNLFCLVLLQRHSVYTSASAPAIELSNRQKSMLCTVRKHSILGVFLLLCNVIWMISMLIFVIMIDDALTTSSRMITIVFQYLAFNTTSVCLYLGFSCNKDMYSCLCRLCDAKCAKLCMGITKKRMKARAKGEHHKIDNEEKDEFESDDAF